MRLNSGSGRTDTRNRRPIPCAAERTARSGAVSRGRFDCIVLLEAGELAHDPRGDAQASATLISPCFSATIRIVPSLTTCSCSRGRSQPRSPPVLGRRRSLHAAMLSGEGLTMRGRRYSTPMFGRVALGDWHRGPHRCAEPRSAQTQQDPWRASSPPMRSPSSGAVSSGRSPRIADGAEGVQAPDGGVDAHPVRDRPRGHAL